MPRKNEGGLDLESVIGSAVGEGISSITQNHPRLKGQEQFLSRYIDKKTLSQYAGKFAKKYQEIDDKDKPRFIEDFYKNLSGYVASGEMFDEKGKKLILRDGWKKRARMPWFGRTNAKEIVNGEEYLDKTIDSFRDLYDLMATTGYGERMPELAKAVKTVYEAGFWDAAINVLYENKKINDKKYLTLKRALKQKVESGVNATARHLEEYLGTAAVVFGGIGLIVILATALANGITGNIIGITNTNSLPALIFGIVSLISGIFLWSKKK
jgi:hypothetical protein